MLSAKCRLAFLPHILSFSLFSYKASNPIFLRKMLKREGNDAEDAGELANSSDLNLDFRSSLIRACTVCSDFSVPMLP